MVTHTEKTTGLRIGYAQVSTHEQSLDSQIENLKQADCRRIYCDKLKRAGEAAQDRVPVALATGMAFHFLRLCRLIFTEDP